MRRVLGIIVLVVILGVVSGVCTAEAQRKDGYWWTDLQEDWKLFYVMGYHAGSESIFNSWWIWGIIEKYEGDPEQDYIPENQYVYLKHRYDYYNENERLLGFLFRQILDGIDSFYGDFRNKGIYIIDAIRVVGMQLHSVEDEVVEEEIRFLREQERKQDSIEKERVDD